MKEDPQDQTQAAFQAVGVAFTSWGIQLIEGTGPVVPAGYKPGASPYLPVHIGPR